MSASERLAAATAEVRRIRDAAEAEAGAALAAELPASLFPELARVAQSLRINPADTSALGYLLAQPGTRTQQSMFAPWSERFQALQTEAQARLGLDAAMSARSAAHRAVADLEARRNAAAKAAEATFRGQRWEQVGSGTNGYGIRTSEARETSEYRAWIQAARDSVV